MSLAELVTNSPKYPDFGQKKGRVNFAGGSDSAGRHGDHLTQALGPALLTALVLAVVVVSISACGGEGSLRSACGHIEWVGRACETLKRVDWAKDHGNPPSTVRGYYSLPEAER